MNLGEDINGDWLGFDSGATIGAGVSNSTMVETADLDGDNDQDILTLTSSGSRRLLINNGSGVFTNETGTRIGTNVLNVI